MADFFLSYITAKKKKSHIFENELKILDSMEFYMKKLQFKRIKLYMFKNEQ